MREPNNASLCIDCEVEISIMSVLDDQELLDNIENKKTGLTTQEIYDNVDTKDLSLSTYLINLLDMNLVETIDGYKWKLTHQGRSTIRHHKQLDNTET